MSEVNKVEQNQPSEKKQDKECCNCSCNCKTERKEYVKRAQRNYRIRRLENDPEYAEQLKQKTKDYRAKNKEKYNEYRSIYIREYRAKKKAEKLAASSTIDTAMEKLTIKDQALIEQPPVLPAQLPVVST